MKTKKWLFAILIALAVVVLGGTFLFLNRQDRHTTLTIVEQRWIEDNKNKVIDFGILNDIAILNDSGSGVFFSFLESLEKTTELSFNKTPYTYGDEIKNEYAFKTTDKVGKNDILIYTDNYVVLSKNNIKYNKLDDIKELTIGVLENNVEEINNYIDNENLVYKQFETIDKLVEEIDKEDSSLDAIILPKLIYLSQDFKEDLYINYNIIEMEDNYVISLGSIDRLNDIIKKYYNKWFKEEYNDEYSKQFTSTYFSKNKVDEQDKAKFRSKRYIYGTLDNPPFDLYVDNDLIGTNSSIISEFSKLSNVEVAYKKFANYNDLIKAFNSNDIDFYFDIYSPVDYKMDIYKTVSSYDEQIVIVSNISNNVTFNSVSSLKGEKIVALNNTKTSDFLKKIGAEVVNYNSISDILKNASDDTLIALDRLAYNYYLNKEFKNFKIDYEFALDTDYNYVVRDIKDNEIFMNFLNFYLSFTNEKELINSGYYATVKNIQSSLIIKIVLISVAVIILTGLVILILVKRKPKKKNSMKKEDKLRYVDMLTSLKNRNYLNDNIEIWDESEIYPQTIIIVDLNNVAYINDNYGHQEGDNVIKEAANILITDQMENSDIIRTNGNEFLIYLVEYDEKQVVSYIRKLNKDLKELSYGFGAAIGYSMITDAIKTIDDAINEATLDMRNNKEELNN